MKLLLRPWLYHEHPRGTRLGCLAWPGLEALLPLLRDLPEAFNFWMPKRKTFGWNLHILKLEEQLEVYIKPADACRVAADLPADLPDSKRS